MTTTPLPPTPRCDAEVYESGPTAANYGINDPDVVVDYTFAQQLERELIEATQARDDLEAEVQRLREALQEAAVHIAARWGDSDPHAIKAFTALKGSNHD